MEMDIGKIVNADSHVRYTCQIYGLGETETIPGSEDFGFGRWVGVQARGGGYLVAIIYDTRLLNPEFGNLGPRLSPEEELAVFSPDYLVEKALLAFLHVVGTLGEEGEALQGVPRAAANSDAPVYTLSEEQVHRFHLPRGQFQIAYLSLLLARREHPLMPSLILQLLQELAALFPEQRQRLDVLRRNIAWQTQIESAR